MKTFKELITELFDKPAKLRYIVNREIEWGTIWQAEFTVDKTDYIVYTEPSSPGEYEVIFEMSGTGFTGKTNVGPKTAVVVFSTVMQFIREFLDEVKPAHLKFSADKSSDGSPDSRSKLYTTMVKKFVPKEYSVKIEVYDKIGRTKYILTRK